MAELRFRDARIEMAHGAGGKASRRLIEGLFLPILANPGLAPLDDAAVIEIGGQKLALTTDSFVVSPLSFSGGSIGTLAVHGTANDLAVSGAKPLALLATFILEAGLDAHVLEREVRALSEAARAAGVAVVAGDTKVVEHGKADGLYLTTAGIGWVDTRLDLSPTRVRPGDQIVLSGPIGDHGITVLLARGEVDLEADLSSDTRSVWPLVERLIDSVAVGLRWMRDPTRGGVASALSELARDANLGITFDEGAVPVRDVVRGACELLGLDPLHIANEGQFIAVVAPEHLEETLTVLHGTPGGEDARRIGSVTEHHPRTVVATTPYGGSRVVDMLVGDPLPRIC
ncbi:MAG: hydrogenase expression/formation protein HypE [Trueperaceae bacterium]|nr:MAG: hydrogenase expression/formation protein HypE [Trueperaceae bacterium]